MECRAYNHRMATVKLRMGPAERLRALACLMRQADLLLLPDTEDTTRYTGGLRDHLADRQPRVVPPPIWTGAPR